VNPQEIVASGELAGDAAGGLATRIHDLHHGIAGRVFGSLGPSAEPIRVIHDGISKSVYAAVSAGTGALVRAGAMALSAATPPDAASVADSRVGRLAVGALNGAFGDLLERRRNALEVQMRFRHGDRDLVLERDALAAALPNAKPQVAIFLHGLCESDSAWKLRDSRHVPYGFRLETELGYTSLYLSYNSGRHISENGRDLADQLARLLAAWPVEIQELALVGHSMGGLVARSACHYGARSAWAAKVRHVFTLGAPHLGAPLEQLAHRASARLARLPETSGIARALNLRSSGIKDLRYGYLIDEDWFGEDQDVYLRRAAAEIPFLETANHYFVCATLAREHDARSARIIGDLLVLHASAWGQTRGQRLRFPVAHYRHIGGATHFDLLNHPVIYDQIRCWLCSRKQLPAPAAERAAQRP
jgi:pimeloyl-ACP methyl ester carboxylesterase